MSASLAQPAEQNPAGAGALAADSQLLVDQFLPRYDLAVVHADVFRVSPAECYRAASELPRSPPASGSIPTATTPQS